MVQRSLPLKATGTTGTEVSAFRKEAAATLVPALERRMSDQLERLDCEFTWFSALEFINDISLTLSALDPWMWSSLAEMCFMLIMQHNAQDVVVAALKAEMEKVSAKKESRAQRLASAVSPV